MTESTTKRQKNYTLSIILWTADLLAIWLAAGILMLKYNCHPFSQSGRIILALSTIAYIPVAWYLKQGHTIQRSTTLDNIFINSFKAIIIHALVFMSASAFIHTDFSITFYVTFYLVLSLVFPIISLTCQKFIKRARRKGSYSTRVAIVGTNDTSTRLADEMLKDSGYGYKIVGYFDTECLPGFKGNYLGNFDVLEQYAHQHKIDEIYFTLVGEKAEKMPRVVRIADNNIINFYYVPKISKYVTGKYQLYNIGTMPILTLRKNPLAAPWKRGLKRGFDIAFSSVFLLLSPIVFIPIAIGIKMTSPGPVFFRQERTGYKGRSFKCFKFRTMRVNSDADKAQATEDDPRKTKFGNFLRRTSIDELPQFINVWRGDMSVVGPRPHMLKHTKDYTELIDKYMVRHIVKPGITGWAQVNGYRGLTDELWKMEKRVVCDVWYIENWTFSLDLKIIFKTVTNALKGDKNAF